MGTISRKIDEIIEKRKSMLSRFEKTEGYIRQAVSGIEQLKSYQKKLEQDSDKGLAPSGSSDVAANIIGISTNEFTEAYVDYMKELTRLKKRFSRDSVNISFIGKAGQGKSLVMQKISGLDSSVIPSASGSHCTGAKSVITNTQSSTVEANISFFNEGEMIGIVNKYLDKITDGRMSISFLSEIPQISMEGVRKKFGLSAEKDEFCKHLRKYIEHFEEYRDELGKNITVSRERIEEYVAQYSCSDNNKKYYKYLGVKLADIKTHFLHEDAGRIVLVDTIGMGATSLGIEEEMLSAAENDSDAIIMMFRPDNERGYIGSDDVTTIDKIAKRVSTDYTKELLFMVLNKKLINGDNTKSVSEVMEELKKDPLPIAAALDVNCISEEEVEQRLLMPVLERMTDRLDAVDALLVKKLNEKGAELYNAYSRICKILDRAFAGAANEDLRRRFSADIEDAYDSRLLNELRDLYIRKYNDLRSKPCEELRSATQEKLKNIVRCVPDTEKILSLLKRGGFNQHNALEKSTDIMRMSIINDFNTLDLVLGKIVEGMKLEVLHIFADQDKGMLGLVYPLDCGSSEWISGFIDAVSAKNKYPMICEALEKFRDYTINVQGFLIHEVREQLDSIDFSLAKTTPSLSNGLADKEKTALEIMECLKKFAYDIRENTEFALNDLFKTPNRSMFAAIKDLYDRLAFSTNGSGETITTEWRYLYEDWMHKIWKERYQRESAMRNTIEEWNSLTASLKETDKAEYFTIGN